MVIYNYTFFPKATGKNRYYIIKGIGLHAYFKKLFATGNAIHFTQSPFDFSFRLLTFDFCFEFCRKHCEFYLELSAGAIEREHRECV